jgi:hypothetical protein
VTAYREAANSFTKFDVTLLRRIAARAMLVAFGILAALVIGEIGLRLLGLARPAFYTYDQYRGWALRPGAEGWDVKEGEAYVSINREGFRGPETTIAKPPGTVRIAVLGDSFTEAQQVAEDRTFSAVIARSVADCPALRGRKAEVLNFGVNGYGTTQELMTLRHQVWQFSPDIVVLAVFTGNDIMNNSVTLETERCRPFYVYRDGEMVLAGPLWDSPVTRMQCMMRFESRLRFDTRQSEIVKVLDQSWRVVKDLLPGRHHKRHQPVGSELGINDVIYKPPADQAWRDAWRVTEGLIEQMNREVKSHGAAFLVLTLSNGIQAWPDPAVRAKYMQRLSVSNLDYPDQRIQSLGTRDGFPVLALAPPLSAYAGQHHVFLHGFKNTSLGEGHWNELGHRLAGELIATKLCDMMGTGQVAAVAKAPAANASH